MVGIGHTDADRSHLLKIRKHFQDFQDVFLVHHDATSATQLLLCTGLADHVPVLPARTKSGTECAAYTIRSPDGVTNASSQWNEQSTLPWDSSPPPMT